MSTNRIYEGLKKGELYKNLLKIEKSVLENTSDYDMECAIKHGVGHSKRIVEYIDKLYYEYFIYNYSLNEYEVFTILAAAYLHDIGFFLRNEKILVDFCYWKKINFPTCNTREFYRSMHHYISAYWIFCNLTNNNSVPKVYFGNPELGYSIMKVVISHGINFWEDTDYQAEVVVSGHIVRLKYLCFLLCLADSMDCDKRRIYGISDINQCPLQERIFIRTHMYIDRVTFSNRKITIYFYRPYLKKEYKNIFYIFYELRPVKWIKRLLELGRDIFVNFDYSLELCIHVAECVDVEEPSEEEYIFIKNNYI